MLKRLIYPLLIAATVMFAGCQAANPAALHSSDNPANTATFQPVISEQEASNIALRIALESQPEIDATNAQPRVREIRQLSFRSALQEMHSQPRADDPLSQSVWLITLSGVWQVGIPGPGATPAPYRTFYVVLDEAGHQLRTSVQP
jgi:hypothetical protein